MSNTNCRKVRREIEAADRGELLSSLVVEHIGKCAQCEAFSDEHSKLRQMVFNLGTVEAPDDFGFRLRARLAAENGRSNQWFSGNLNFGFRSAAFATLLLMFGAGMLWVNFRPTESPAVVTKTPAADQVEKPAAPSDQTGSSSTVTAAATSSGSSVSDIFTGGQGTKVAISSRPARRIVSRDMGASTAKVSRPNDLTARAEFPIETSPQPLKVSVDDGRGSSHTISVSRVSFGSQRALSQSNSPLMASARGAW